MILHENLQNKHANAAKLERSFSIYSIKNKETIARYQMHLQAVTDCTREVETIVTKNAPPIA